MQENVITLKKVDNANNEALLKEAIEDRYRQPMIYTHGVYNEASVLRDVLMMQGLWDGYYDDEYYDDMDPLWPPMIAKPKGSKKSVVKHEKHTTRRSGSKKNKKGKKKNIDYNDVIEDADYEEVNSEAFMDDLFSDSGYYDDYPTEDECEEMYDSRTIYFFYDVMREDEADTYISLKDFGDMIEREGYDISQREIDEILSRDTSYVTVINNAIVSDSSYSALYWSVVDEYDAEVEEEKALKHKEKVQSASMASGNKNNQQTNNDSHDGTETK